MRYARPDGTRYQPQKQPSYLPDGCAYRLAVPVFALAIILLFAFAFHPQGFLLIPWIFSHL